MDGLGTGGGGGGGAEESKRMRYLGASTELESEAWTCGGEVEGGAIREDRGFGELEVVMNATGHQGRRRKGERNRFFCAGVLVSESKKMSG